MLSLSAADCTLRVSLMNTDAQQACANPNRPNLNPNPNPNPNP